MADTNGPLIGAIFLLLTAPALCDPHPAGPGFSSGDSNILNLDQGCFRDPVLQLVHGRRGNLLRMIPLVRITHDHIGSKILG
jgi:hypothetical protein